MKIDIYKTLTYAEDEMKRNPVAYSQNGNRKTQHVTISNSSQVEAFLEKYGLNGIKDENISLSILWNLPRRKYFENDMWVCISGFTYGNEPPFVPKRFVIADNAVTTESQNKAVEIINLLNKWTGIDVSYCD